METHPESSLQLARQLIEGDLNAFNHFVEEYHPKLFRYVYTMCGHREDAEEVSQETLLKVFQSLEQLQDPRLLKPWVFRIARNACLMKRRKSLVAPRQEVSLDQLMPSKEGAGQRLEIADWSRLPEDLASQEELRAALDGAVRTLPEAYRAVFLLRDVEGLSTGETAHALELSEDAVKQRLHRARLMLRKDLEQFVRRRSHEPAGV